MEKLTNQEKLRPWQGFVLFAAVMVFFIFACAPMQLAWGIPGLIATELSFLVIAIVYGLVRKIPLKEMFPIRMPKFRDIAGSLILVLGGSMIGITSVGLIGTLFPQTMNEAAEMSDMLYGTMSLPVMILVVALMPAVCEEAIHRGAILAHFRSIKKEWIIVLIMAIFFGINHVSFLRFFNTALLGACLTYVLVKKNNFILNMLMHFSVNCCATLITYMSSLAGANSSNAANIDMLPALGLYLILGFLAPVFIVIGTMLIDPKSHKKIRFLFAGILSVIMLVSGIAVTSYAGSKNAVLNSTISYEVTADSMENSMLDFEIEEDRSATISVVLVNAEGDYTIRIDGDSGSNIINAEIPSGAIRTLSYNVDLKADHYTITIVPGDNAIGEQPQIQIMIQ